MKSKVIGSGNLDEYMLNVCGALLGMKVVKGILKHLGLPMTVERSKVKMFQWLENKVQGKIQECNSSFLSAAGKEALIKTCVQSYPIFAMSCFCFPRILCDKLSANALHFWWASGGTDKGIHWVHKETLVKKGRYRI